MADVMFYDSGAPLPKAQGRPATRDAFSDRTNLNGTAADTGRVIFSSCKGETHTHRTGFKQLFRRLRTLYRPDALEHKEDLHLQALGSRSVLVLGCPTEKFSSTELDMLKIFILRGGSLLVMLAAGGEARCGTNINHLLEEFGIVVNDDCVVRSAPHKYFHPKEALISDGILNREIVSLAGKGGNEGFSDADPDEEWDGRRGGRDRRGAFDGSGLSFVYPHGATLTVHKPAVAVLSSGSLAYPTRRPLGALWSKEGSGRLAVLGCAGMFDDKWLDKEDNGRLMDFLFKWLRPGDHDIDLDPHDADEPNLNEAQPLPDTEALAERLRCCLQADEELSHDWTTLFDDKLFSLNPSLVPQAAALFGALNVKKGPLTLITPQFETPLPPLQAAVFPPPPREPPPPALELFDLDEHFASDHVKLGHLTNKCIDGGDADLPYFVQASAQILGLGLGDSPDPKAVLAEVFQRVVQYKMASATSGPAVMHQPGFL
ncbi:hypothetical protein WJX72_012202 [[Myrmecia] bisecta]|uniref:Uncharacterized protein n=1 Tax=[Myrmecia] bisecta TaxID=41462 RepID=A0AAW1P3S0_9CHLO